MTFSPLPAEGSFTIVGSVAEAVCDVEFVQESAPELLELKQRLIAEASRVAAPETLVCSSTSGFLPSLLQAKAEHPGRVLVGHPSNPVYLLPLVEVCGGQLTDPRALERAWEIYRSLGMHPLVRRKEVDGCTASRLQEALWREALWLVHDDVATVQDVDDVVRLSFGLRYPALGLIQGSRITVAETNTRTAMQRLSLSFKKYWSKLTDVPEFTDAFLDKLTVQSDEQVGSMSLAELEKNATTASSAHCGVCAGRTMVQARRLRNGSVSWLNAVRCSPTSPTRCRCRRSSYRLLGWTSTATSRKDASSSSVVVAPSTC